MQEFGTRSPWRCAPGATRSGARQLAAARAPAEKAATVSSPSVGVPIESEAPTAMTYGS